MSKFVNDLEEFLKLDYKMEILPFEEEGEKGFVIKCPELKGLEVFGETIQDAMEEVNKAKIALFDIYKRKNIGISYPTKINY